MKNTTYVPLKNDLLLRLIERYKENYPLAIDDVIEEFLERTDEDHELASGARAGGYIWNSWNCPRARSCEPATSTNGRWRL